jgi:hypothetical protein
LISIVSVLCFTAHTARLFLCRSLTYSQNCSPPFYWRKRRKNA